MHKNKITLFLLVLCFSSFGQDVKIKSPSSFFPEAKAEVLIVGAFHFHYPNLDVHKTEEKDQVDVLKEPKKTEVTELVEYIKKFKPTKIAIEAKEEWKAGKKLKEYKTGLHLEERDERFQLGFRIAKELKLDTVYSIDTTPFSDDLKKVNPEAHEKLYKDYDFKSDDPYEDFLINWLEYEDQVKTQINLLDYFKHSNTEEYHRLSYGIYLIGDFKLDNERGADIISTWWYNRNLRMFRNVQKITENVNDRILVIVGNGHAAVLRHLFESSPEYRLIEFEHLEDY